MMNQLLSSKNKILKEQLLTEFAESFASFETGEEFFHALSNELAYKTQLDYVAFGRLTYDKLSISTFSFWYQGNLMDNIIYPLADSPCEQVIKNNLYTFPDTCQIDFPKNDTIKELRVEGYIGYPIFDYQRNIVGLINILHKNLIENDKYVTSLLQVVSKRVEIELMRIENEKEMRKSNLRLERQNYGLTSFNHAVSHDLQEPLRKIRMFISRMNGEDDQSLLPDRFMYCHSRIEDAVIRMQTLIKDLLVFSSIHEKDSLFDKTDLTEIVQDCVKQLADQIHVKEATIEIEDLPVIRAIPFQLRQLVTNILDNALKYTREGIRPKIKIKSTIVDKGDPDLRNAPNIHNQYLKISFSDNGIGLDKNYAEIIFTPFKRLHMQDEYPGSGIGLAICKKTVETHQGLITAVGRMGFGSTFRVYLPIHQ